MNEDGIAVFVKPTHSMTANVENETAPAPGKIERSRLFQFEGQPSTAVAQNHAQITTQKLDKSRLGPFNEQSSSFDAAIRVEPDAIVINKLDPSRLSPFNQPSSTSSIPNESTPVAKRLNPSLLSLFQQEIVVTQIDNNNLIDEEPAGAIEFEQVVASIDENN